VIERAFIEGEVRATAASSVWPGARKSNFSFARALHCFARGRRPRHPIPNLARLIKLLGSGYDSLKVPPDAPDRFATQFRLLSSNL
jgi:hypothetical protein